MLTSKNKKITHHIVNWPFKLTARWSVIHYIADCYPWLIIMFCALFTFYKFVLQVSPSVMTSELMQTFHVNAAGLGNLAATYFYAYLAAQFFVGPLLDRYSPRYLTAFAIGLCAIGTLLFANTQSLWIAGMARALVGVGVAFSTVNYMKMSALWFGGNKIAFIDGLLATAAMFGALCGQIPLLLLVAQSGWKSGLIYCGLFGLVLSLAFVLCVRDKKTSAHDDAERSSLKLTDFLVLLRTKQNWLLAAYAGLAFTPLSVLGGLWGNPFFITAYHLTPAQASSLSSSMFIGLGIGAPLLGFLADRWLGRIKTMGVGTTLALISLVLIIYVANLHMMQLSALLFMFGVGTGAFMSCYAFGKELNQVRLAATVISLINSGDALFGSFTEPLIGQILDHFWLGTVFAGIHVFPLTAFHYAFSLLPIYLLSALCCLWFLSKYKTI